MRMTETQRPDPSLLPHVFISKKLTPGVRACIKPRDVLYEKQASFPLGETLTSNNSFEYRNGVTHFLLTSAEVWAVLDMILPLSINDSYVLCQIVEK